MHEGGNDDDTDGMGEPGEDEEDKDEGDEHIAYGCDDG